MKTTNHKFRPRTSLILLIALAVWAICGTSYAQTVIGSPGAGFQKWTAGDLLFDAFPGGSPFWNTEWGASQPNDEGSPAEKNAGFCMTSTGDCQGIGSALFAPGALPFWGMPFTSGNGSVAPSGGARDPHVILKNSGTQTSSGYRWQTFRATLYANLSANPSEINQFGWFETDAAGDKIGAIHELFSGSEASPPSAVGSTLQFTPTQYFGYYYRDFSEGNCFTYTLFNFNDANCTGSFNEHDIVVFTTNSANQGGDPTMWIVGEDPQACYMNDADCNLTIVKVSPVGE